MQSTHLVNLVALNLPRRRQRVTSSTLSVAHRPRTTGFLVQLKGVSQPAAAEYGRFDRAAH
jgi:hypothetical protein